MPDKRKSRRFCRTVKYGEFEIAYSAMVFFGVDVFFNKSMAMYIAGMQYIVYSFFSICVKENTEKEK